METPFLDRLIENLQNHNIANSIESIIAGSNAGIPETRKELTEYEAIKKALATHRFIESLLSEESAKKIALEYTGAEEEYQGFILACGVITEKIKQNL